MTAVSQAPGDIRLGGSKGRFRTAMVICASLLAAAVLSAVTIDNGVLQATPTDPVPEPECRTCCPVGAPPIEPGNPVEA